MWIIARWDKLPKPRVRPWAFGWVWSVLLTLPGCTHQPTTHKEMEAEFEAEFGFLPPPEVSGYKCSVVSVGDSLGTWFSFQCSRAMFEKIHAVGFQSTHAADSLNPDPVWHMDLELGDKGAPPWWPGISKSATIFWKEWHSKDQTGHFIYVWREEGSGRVYSKCGDWR